MTNSTVQCTAETKSVLNRQNQFHKCHSITSLHYLMMISPRKILYGHLFLQIRMEILQTVARNMFIGWCKYCKNSHSLPIIV